MRIKGKGMYWLTNHRSKLSTQEQHIENRLLICKSIMKPMWTYDVQQLRTQRQKVINLGRGSTKVETLRSIVLHTTTYVLWYVRNKEIREDVQIFAIKERIQRISGTYKLRAINKPKALANTLNTDSVVERR